MNAIDPSGHALVSVSVSFYDDPTLSMFFGGGGGGGACGTVCFVGSVAKEIDFEYTISTGVMAGTSWYGHTTGWTGCVSEDTSGNVALQSTQTIGESTCLAPGVSLGISKTYSTANDVQYLSGNSSSFGFTVCVGVGISFDFIWFTNPTGKQEYAITIGILFGAELEAHGAISDTKSTESWDPFN